MLHCCCYIFRFIEGLQTADMHTEIIRNSAIWRELFVPKATQLEARTVQRLFNVVWSVEGSNRHTQELRVNSYFKDLLVDLEGKDH